jgi:hypothetical protein
VDLGSLSSRVDQEAAFAIQGKGPSLTSAFVGIGGPNRPGNSWPFVLLSIH